MHLVFLAALISISTSSPVKDVTSYVDAQIAKSHFTEFKRGHLRGAKPGFEQNVPQITDDMISPRGNTDAKGVDEGWSEFDNEALSRILDERENGATVEPSTAKQINNERIISTQPGLVDLPPDDPLADRFGSPYHYTNGKVSHENYYACYDEVGYRPTTTEIEKFKADNIQTKLGKDWIGPAKERTVASHDDKGDVDFVAHGEKYNSCCCCCKTWTIQARNPNWVYDAYCKVRKSYQTCYGSGDSRHCTTHYYTDTDRVQVTPYFETKPCCCEIGGCCGRIRVKFRGNA